MKHRHIETFTGQDGGQMHLQRVSRESGHCRCTHAKRSQEVSDQDKEADRIAICVLAATRGRGEKAWEAGWNLV